MLQHLDAVAQEEWQHGPSAALLRVARQERALPASVARPSVQEDPHGLARPKAALRPSVQQDRTVAPSIFAMLPRRAIAESHNAPPAIAQSHDAPPGPIACDAGLAAEHVHEGATEGEDGTDEEEDEGSYAGSDYHCDHCGREWMDFDTCPACFPEQADPHRQAVRDAGLAVGRVDAAPGTPIAGDAGLAAERFAPGTAIARDEGLVIAIVESPPIVSLAAEPVAAERVDAPPVPPIASSAAERVDAPPAPPIIAHDAGPADIARDAGAGLGAEGVDAAAPMSLQALRTQYMRTCKASLRNAHPQWTTGQILEEARVSWMGSSERADFIATAGYSASEMKRRRLQ